MKVKKLTPKQAAEYFSVNVQTLRVWDKEGKIKTERTPGGDRRYIIEIQNEYHVCYCRVSSHKQKDDLEKLGVTVLDVSEAYTSKTHPQTGEVKNIGSAKQIKLKTGQWQTET
ncbi:MAG: MerR family DNA-binding transcriptional regulator [Desulfobacteraceae bacterium]|nr:MerR family DNA-binding transcriptional regulator [Desulfobacteraceae bacterium]